MYALCPFHDDHSPSMSISPDKQIYKCFVCGNGGNVFTFVQNYEKISFPEAVARVAQLIGYQLSVNPTAERKAGRSPQGSAVQGPA
jgi:DNA primase